MNDVSSTRLLPPRPAVIKISLSLCTTGERPSILARAAVSGNGVRVCVRVFCIAECKLRDGDAQRAGRGTAALTMTDGRARVRTGSE